MKPCYVTICSKLFAVILLVEPAIAMQSSGEQAGQAGTNTTVASKRVTIDDVIAMVGAGVSNEVIIAELKKANQAFDLSTGDLIRLKKAGVSDSVLKVMIDPRATPTSSTPEAGAARQPSTPGFPYANPSGATPSSGSGYAGDANDPLAPHDSGIYLYTKDREGKPVMIPLERAAYQGTKTGGILASAMTYGIAKAKMKAVIPGPRAEIRVNDSSPVFYFYFDDKQAGLGKTSYFGVGNLSNPNQFALLKLEVDKSNRETIIGQFSALGASSGSDEKAMIPFRSERIRPGLYKVVVEGVKAGEYCFLASGPRIMAGAYGAGAVGAADIFDFGVSLE